ncbi:hypothetical protein [Clostridium sp. LIBA-8841]|uniref:YobI family P-loop NTPase n=1 Tax=Clostridium sp. LIBA-8841 TaxID=2987530 RepID=UPI002AC7C2D9|nr:hypothetical protein [Clostridium sp. LIBA-8841]MDZ5253777.1 hypothetical protein [Clostridium sp. LIBA-8841]
MNFIEKEKENNIKVLSPNDDLPKDDIYIRTLLEAIKNKKALNIALSGPYGAGKSSVIESFKKHYEEFKCINISLANFLEKQNNESIGAEKDSKKDKIDSLQDQLERSILKQLFYKVNYSKIPNSRFKRINEFTILKVSKILLIAIIAMIPIILFNVKWLSEKYVECKEIILTFLQNQFSINPTEIQFIFIIGGVCLISLIFLVFLIKFILNSFSIKSIKASKSVELNLEAQSDIKSFDKYIDEIMYFFKKNKYNVVFFEDLDRFNNIEIFTRLRELNNIINESEEINTNKLMIKRKIKFVYAIKDDIFSCCNEKDKKNQNEDFNCCKNRTKFFDYIIPVIPKIDSNNSFGELKKLIDEYNEDKIDEDKIKISKQFINDVSIFIDDMRLLTNTFNEFLIYYEKIKIAKTEEMFQKLFAIILYKNLYPSDFAKLKNNESYINNVINKKRDIIEERLNSIDKSIERKKKEKINTEKECLNSFDELIEVYSNAWNNKKIISVAYNNSDINLEDLTMEQIENIEKIEKIEIIEDGYRYNTRKTINNEDFATVYGSKRNFFERFNTIKNINGLSCKERIENLENEIKELSYKKNRLNLMPLKYLLEDKLFLENFKIELYKDNFEGNDILLLFFRRAYIDEKYNDLISIFIEGKITKEEKYFLKEVTCDKKLDLDYSLKNIKEVIDEISLDDFRNECVLNLDILKFIFENFEDYKINARNILEQFKELDDFKLKVLYALRDRDLKSFNIFILRCIELNPKIFYELCFNEKIDEISRERNFNSILKGVCEETLLENIASDIKKYLLRRVDFINMDIVNEIPEKIINIINALNIKFERLENSKSENDRSSKVVEHIYTKNLYCINKNMLRFLFNEKFYNDFNEEIYRGSNNENNLISYSNIMNSGMKNIIEYINKNINIYLENVLLSENNVSEEGDKIISLINASSAKEENIIKLIKKRNFKIQYIDNVNNTIYWKYLMENRVVEFNWRNIVSYYGKLDDKNLDDILIGFLDNKKVVKKLSEEKLGYEEDETKGEELVTAIILNMKLSENSLSSLVKSFERPFIDLDLESIPENRISFLIDKKMIGLSESIYNQINRKNAIKLILNCIDDYIKDVNLYELEEGEIGIILTSDKITTDNKVSIIKELGFENLELNKNYNIIEELISDVDDDEFFRLKESIKLEKIKKLIKDMDNLEVSEIKNKLKDIDDKYKEFLGFNGYFELELDDVIIEFLDDLESKGVVSSHKEVNEKIRVYRKKK